MDVETSLIWPYPAREILELRRAERTFRYLESHTFPRLSPAVPLPQLGVYLLYFKKCLVYIGKAVNLQARVRFHALQGAKFDAIAWLCPAKDKDLEYLERLLIRKYKPPYNGELTNYEEGRFSCWNPDEVKRAGEFLWPDYVEKVCWSIRHQWKEYCCESERQASIAHKARDEAARRVFASDKVV